MKITATYKLELTLKPSGRTPEARAEYLRKVIEAAVKLAVADFPSVEAVTVSPPEVWR